MGEGGAGRRPARRREEAAEGAQDREEACRHEKGRTQKGCGQKDGCEEGEAETLGRQHYATWLRLPCISAVYSGSTSQTTRLRPLRLAA